MWESLTAGAPALSDPNIANPTATGFVGPATYRVTATDAMGCEVEAMVSVNFQEECMPDPSCENAIRVPNVFTPNGEGSMNETLILTNVSGAVLEMFVIYDRWGNQVFSTNDISMQWNGKVNMTGRDVAQDVYGYYITGECPDGGRLEEAGNITVLR